MPSGLYVKGELGQVQIDENYRNVALMTSGSVALPGQFGEVVVTVPASIAMVAFRCEKWIYVHETQLGGGLLRYFIRNGEPGAGAPVQFYGFGVPAGGGTSGIEVMDAAGQQVFHSDFSYWNYHAILNSQGVNEIDYTAPFAPLVVQLGQSTYVEMYNEADAYFSTTYFRTVGNRTQSWNAGGVSAGNYPGNYTFGENGARLLLLDPRRIY
ncbi:hypothetical protein [Achromobacter marplatensis]|uniref:hypothetical protein n=1 Tax=Achromobacter marplatensis TaxID=470868 RepID=UPI0028F05D58|nr:hypothetical protein [Achromobacter marplatensis]